MFPSTSNGNHVVVPAIKKALPASVAELAVGGEVVCDTMRMQVTAKEIRPLWENSNSMGACANQR
jgi:hypothetical protein